MIRLFFLIFLTLGLQACSFSKTPGDDASTVKRQSEGQVASLRQKNLLAAVRSGDVALVEQALQKLEVSEYSFIGLSETPMGVALKSDNLEVAKLLIGKSVDPYNLGSKHLSFTEDTLKLRHQSLLKLLSHSRKLKEMKVAVNETTVFVMDFYLKAIKEILAKVSAGNASAAVSMIDRLGLSCLFVQTQVIQSVQLGEFANSDAVISFLKELPCDSKLSSSNVQLLYEGELIRQFQVLFEDPSLLGYLSHQPNLKTTMWNIDDSGIFLAPELLIRIAWSADNEFSKPGQCPPHNRYDDGTCGYSIDNEEQAQKLFTDSGIKRSKFEIIKTQDGRLVSWSRYFPRVVRGLLAEADVIYYFTSFYCSGKADFSGITFPYLAGVRDEDLQGSSIPWKAAFLTRPDRIRPMTDEYEEEAEEDVPPHLMWLGY